MELNAPSQKVEAGDNCPAEIKKQATDMTFNALSDVLPFPVKPGLPKTTGLVPFQQELNQEHRTINMNCNQYFEVLPKEQELRKESEVIREKIYTSNTPQWHTFKWKKLSQKTHFQ